MTKLSLGFILVLLTGVLSSTKIEDDYMPRPEYNAAGVGFYVVGNKLYDANGKEFRIRGVNRCHYDSCPPNINATHANTMRWIMYFNETSHMLDLVQQQNINQKVVAIPGNWDGTCKEDTGVFNEMVDTWVSQYSQWHTLEKYMIINIANEWGPSNSTTWRDSYINGIQRMRTAGYTTTIQVTSGGCGQDNADIVRYGQDVLNADPLKNVLFDQHIYGNWCYGDGDCQSWQTQLSTGLNALQSTGLAVIVGEFGPGRNIGPSPTMITPTQVISACEARGFGWMAWAWDDPGCYGCSSEASCENTFTLSWDGWYNSTKDLTDYGRQVVEDPTYGTLKLGTPASIFG
jgi:mannan endo-1,4-beta-mannosidase